MGKPEAKVEDHLVEGIAARKGRAAKVTDAGRRGAPDRICYLPNRVVIHVETKAKEAT